MWCSGEATNVKWADLDWWGRLEKQILCGDDNLREQGMTTKGNGG
jgi:hypothetical protein